MKNIFAERMRQTMFLKGVRQAELVDKTGIDKGSLSSYVNGRYMPNADKIAKIATALGVSVNFLLGKEEIPIAKFTLPQFHDVPVLGSVAAGTPILAQEDVIGTVMTDKDVFALKVKGDSMSPRIMDGDIVLVRQQDAAEDGDLVIAEIDGEATCKVLKRSHASVMLVPFNAAFTPIVYTGQEAEDLRILGKVVESRHEW